MTNITSAAAAARENARSIDGRFGRQQHTAPDDSRLDESSGRRYATRDDAIGESFIPAVEAGVDGDVREQFDFDAIADDVLEWDRDAGQYRVAATAEEFWASVERHAR